MNSEIDTTVIPYNTRHKLFSSPALGIQLPVTHATRAPRRLLPPCDLRIETPPHKKLKRSYQATKKISTDSKCAPENRDNTPPRSPEAESQNSDDETRLTKIDLDEINDDVVEAVVNQLQQSRNRPHLVKELATILGRQGIKVVEQSANPSAIISSRLSSFMKRSWSVASPCPIAKELESVHPRRTYYYLTTYQPQSISNSSNSDYAVRAIVSPPISSAASQDDGADEDRRRELSPSPEIELSSLEYDDDDINQEISRSSSFCFPNSTNHVQRNHRSTSPPLEKDEKEFTQTARGMQKRKFGDLQLGLVFPETDDYPVKSIDSDVLFGRQSFAHSNSLFSSSSALKNSPALKRHSVEPNDVWIRIESDWDTRSPENIELHELDELFEDL
ncbi:hypothetical protein K3495_g5001 [Podosphaera aphanis]|nr:hypothetical protein K3495_g5001 [Podosphaera aphanis]